MNTALRRALLAFTLVAHAVPLQAGAIEVQVNRPRDAFQCDTPLGVEWYGSTDRCLAELCGGQNVTNEYLFDEHSRRRRNPCYGRSPTEFRD
jgi:hypothetical protein